MKQDGKFVLKQKARFKFCFEQWWQMWPHYQIIYKGVPMHGIENSEEKLHCFSIGPFQWKWHSVTIH